MTDELSPDVVEMDALLRRVSQVFAYPPAPPLAPAVMSAVRQRAAARPSPLDALRGWWPFALRVAGAAAAAALLAFAGALAAPGSRDAIADFFGLSNVRVEVGEQLGPPPPVLAPENFARPSSVEEVERLVDFDLRYPARDGERLYPDEVYFSGDTKTVIFVYEAEGFDLYQGPGGFGKGVPQSYEQIEFDTGPAYWFPEGGHIAWSLDAQGRMIVETRRTVERASLLWENRDEMITYRLETSLSQPEALEVARSLR